MLPEWPFAHMEHMNTDIIKTFPSLTAEFSKEYREPCVIFADHPCLRMGDALHFMKVHTNTPKNGFGIVNMVHACFLSITC